MSRYQVGIASAAKKELARLPKKMADRIVAAIDALADNPRPHGAIKLEGSENQYRIRVGDYRVIYSINDGALMVLIIRIADRKDAYR